MTSQPAQEAVTDADRIRACERLSRVLGRHVAGGWQSEQLAAEYAACWADGYRTGQDQATR